VIRKGFSDALHLLLQRDPSIIDAAAHSLQISILAVAAAGFTGIGLGLLLSRRMFTGRRAVIVLCRVGMSVPTVLIGLLLFGMLSRRGPLGSLELLYTPWAIVIGEFFLALPIVTTLSHGAFQRLDPRVAETALTLGAGPLQSSMTYLLETRLALVLAVLTAFSRCFTELGIAMMVGGNLPGRTRTLTTATALETSRGEFARGFAMSLILLLIALLVTVAVAQFDRQDRGETS